MSLSLKICDWQTAKIAVQRWYYRNEMPRGKYVAIGAWEDGKFIGVIMFGPGACDALGKRWGLKQREVCEMTRLALGEHSTPTSRILGIALRILHKKCPGIKVVVSFCDPSAGHIGTIYQATGWIYTGETNMDAFYVAAGGTKYHSRNVAESGYKIRDGKKTKCPKPSECEKIVTPPKHRYVYCFDVATRDKINSLDYPKRAESMTLMRPAFQPGEGGETPTSALQ